MPEVEDMEAVKRFAVALDAPLSDEDRRGGWTDEARLASLEPTRKALADLGAGWGEMADYASRHLMRALDHWGIDGHRSSPSPLTKLASTAQAALLRLRETRT
jgi:hypothetical protein